jgi:hypothetical protein
LGIEGTEELVLLLGRTEDNDVVQIEETEVQGFHELVIKYRKVWAAFLRPKDVQGNSLLVSVSLGENLVVHSNQGNFTYCTHSLYIFRDAKVKDLLCISVACNLIIH